MSEKKIPNWVHIWWPVAIAVCAMIVHLSMAPHLDGIGEQVDFVGRLGTDIPTLAARVDAEDDSFYVSFDVTPTYVVGVDTVGWGEGYYWVVDSCAYIEAENLDTSSTNPLWGVRGSYLYHYERRISRWEPVLKDVLALKVQAWLDSTDYKVLMGMIEVDKEAERRAALPWNERPIEAVWDTGGIYYDSVWVVDGRPPACFVQIPCPDNKPGCLVFHSRPCTPPKAGKPDAVDTLHDGTIIRTWIRDPNKVPEEK